MPGAMRLVWRGRLVELLQAATASPLTIVQAPFGYGKTIAVEQFAQATRSRDVWIDHQRLGRDGLPPLEQLVWKGETTVLVLEDFQYAPEVVVEQVRELVPALPADLRLLLTTRRSLGLPVGRWRAHGLVAEIGLDDLRFTPAETAAAFGASALDPPLEAGIRRITERCEGWASGLGLFAGSIGDSSSGGREELDQRAGAALLDAVIGDQPADVQDFLLTTSILFSFNADLSRAVTGSPAAGQLIDRVRDANLLVSLDDQHVWFRYPRLLAELMRARLGERGPDAIRALHRRAADWLLEHRQPEAIGHLVAAGEGDDALKLLVADLDLLNRNVRSRGIDWGSVFPASWVEDSPSRMIYVASILTRSGWWENAASWLERAEAALGETDADHPGHGLLLSTRAMWYSVNGDVDEATRLGREALALMDDSCATPVGRRLLAMLAMVHLARNEADEAEALCDELDSPRSPEVVHAHILPALRSQVAECRGELVEAEQLANAALRALEALDLPLFHGAVTESHIALARVQRERNSLDEAEAHALSAVEVSEQHGWRALLMSSRAELANVRAARNGPDAGLAVVAEVRHDSEIQPLSSIGNEVLVAVEARLRLAAGDPDRAEPLIRAMHPGRQQDVLRVQLALGRGHVERAAELLAAIPPASDRRSRLVHAVLSARIAAARHDDAGVEEQLLEAATTGAPVGFCRTFVDLAPELVPALREVAGTRNQLRPMAVAFDELQATGATGGGLQDQTFSRREQTVLRYLPSELTNREIATELEITTNTLKTHLRSIYRKLNVTSRAAAVRAIRAHPTL